jgi:hypothetical protein
VAGFCRRCSFVGFHRASSSSLATVDPGTETDIEEVSERHLESFSPACFQPLFNHFDSLCQFVKLPEFRVLTENAYGGQPPQAARRYSRPGIQPHPLTRALAGQYTEPGIVEAVREGEWRFIKHIMVLRACRARLVWRKER